MKEVNSRLKLRELVAQRKRINCEINRVKYDYLEEFKGEQLMWISDHAIVRYIERVLKQEVPSSHLGEKDSVAKYITQNGLCGEEFRNNILTLKEQEFIIKSGVGKFTKDGFTYIIRDFTLVTVLESTK